MDFLFKGLLLLLLVFSPCVVGCSSQRSASEAERIEAEDDADPAAYEDEAGEE